MIVTRLVVDGVELDLGQDRIPFPVTYRIADVKEPQNRKRNKSKTIKLPGTLTNKSFFASAWDVSLADVDGGGLVGFNFDPSQRSEAQYYEGSELIFDGLLQLLSVKKLDKKYYFEVSLFSNFVDVFKAVDKIDLPGLGWGEYDHTLNRTNIKNSWDTSVVIDGTPTSNFTAGVPDGLGYVYGHIDWGYTTTLQSMTTTDLVPGVYFKEVMEKILAFNGLTISSSFFSSERYKRLVLTWGGGEKAEVSATELARRAAELTADIDYNNSFISSSQYWQASGQYYKCVYIATEFKTQYSGILSSEVVTQGAYNPMNTTTYKYTVPQKGTYKFTYVADLDLTVDFSAAVTNPITNSEGSVRLQLYKNGSLIYFQDWTGSLGSTVNYSVNIDRDFSLEAGDVLEVQYKVQAQYTLRETDISNLPTLDITLADTGAGIEVDFVGIDAPLTDGETVQLARFLPPMKCSDFLKGNIRMFNLYITEPDENGVVTIEPLEDYYQPTTVYDDWTALLDHSKEMEIVPAGNLVKGKRYIFEWTPSDDYYNKQYRDKYDIGYGNRVYEVASTFQKGEVNYTVPFSQSIPIEIAPGFITPRIINVDPLTEAVSPYKGAARCFIYNGLVAGNWRLKNDSDATQYDDLTTYPQVNHVQDLSSYTFDLNFDKPIIIYWAATGYTTNNLWQYNEKFIKEVTGRDAKIIRAYFKLGSKEIRQGFDRSVMLNGVLFRKNEIKDYEAGTNATNLVELVRIIEGDSPQITTITELANLPGGDYSDPTTGDPTGSQDSTVTSGGIDQVNESSNTLKG